MSFVTTEFVMIGKWVAKAAGRHCVDEGIKVGREQGDAVDHGARGKG